MPAIVTGRPGAGKTAYVRALARKIAAESGAEYPLHIIVPSRLDPTDLQGMPFLDDVQHNGKKFKATRWTVPYWAFMLAQGGLLFIDEANTGSPQVMSACLALVLDSQVADFKFAASRVLVQNPPAMVAGALPLSAPMANRVCHLGWDVDTPGWVDAMTTGAFKMDLPIMDTTKYVAFKPRYAALTAAFIRANPAALDQFPQNEEAQSGPFPSPRSWEMGQFVLAGADAAGFAPLTDTALTLLAGCVGQGVTNEFASWLRNANLPDPEILLANPATYSVPRRGDLVHAVVTSVATAAAGNLTRARWDAAWAIIMATSRHGNRDAAVVGGQILAKARTSDGTRFAPPAEAAEFYSMASQVVQAVRRSATA